MKKSALIFLLVIISFTSHAQNDEVKTRKSEIGITFSSFGQNNIFRSRELLGAASYNADKFFSLGVNYLYKLNNTFNIETGIEYSNHQIIIKPNLPPQYDNSPYGARFSLIDIPATLRVNFLKYCFINGGLLLAIDTGNSSPINSQTGIGSIVGLGIKYEFNSGYSVYVNPYYKEYLLLSFSGGDNLQKLRETGFRFGVMFKLK